MIRRNVVLLFCCIGVLPGYHFQIPGFGNKNSIGKQRYPPSAFYAHEYKYQKWGVNGGRDTRWPNGIIPYNFDETTTDQKGNRFDKKWQDIQIKGFEAFTNNTCLRFVPQTTEKDYITLRFTTGTCSSSVGRIGGQQFVNMQDWCLPDIHEMLHAIGFEHEENRRDRDYYMAFNWTNIKPNTPKDDEASNGWYQKNNRPTYGTVLDPKSIMTSSQWNGQIDRAITTFIFQDGSNPNINAAYKYYSEGDRHKINRAYNCNPEDNCWDEDPFNCPVWAKAGACEPTWVPKVCPKTCCFDLSRKCDPNDQTHCNSPAWATWCNQTCNQCPTMDNRDDCLYIGATLGCTTDQSYWPGGMEKYCRKSCGFCKRPAEVEIKPLILTKCMKTCNYWCQKFDGCNPSLPFPTEPCPAECVDEDSVNCPHLAATKGCFSLYDDASIILN